MRPLISSVRVQVLGGHAHIDVWARGGKSGSLCVDAGDARELVARITATPIEAIDEFPTDGSSTHVIVEQEQAINIPSRNVILETGGHHDEST